MKHTIYRLAFALRLKGAIDRVQFLEICTWLDEEERTK